MRANKILQRRKMSRMPSKARQKKPSRLTRALLETAKDMKDGGVLTEPAYAKITFRHLGKSEASPLFDPPEAWSNGRDALRPDKFHQLRTRRSGQGCRRHRQRFETDAARGQRFPDWRTY